MEEGIKVLFLKPTEFLYRANKNKNNNFKYSANSVKPGNLASKNYEGAQLKYFSLSENGTKSYQQEGVSIVKEWELNQNSDKIKLVDILDLSTRIKLKEKFTTTEEKKALEKAFPIVDNSRVSRNSRKTEEDNIVLKKICNMGYDGYYMTGPDINKEASHSFHSEVGLCRSALSKLKLKSTKKIKNPEKTKKVSRAEYEARQKLYSNNKNNNNRNNMNTTRKKRFRLNNKPIAKQLF